MKKGINQWAFPSNMKLKECLMLARKAGFDGFEPCLAQSGEFSLESSEETVRSLAETANKIGIELPSIATGLLWDYPLNSVNRQVQETAKEIVRRMLLFASYLGSSTILIIPGIVDNPFNPSSEIIPYDVAYSRSLAALKELAPIAERYKVVIGIENVWNKFLLSPLEMREFIDSIGSPYVGVYLDVANSLAYGYPEQWIYILGKERIAKVHVKDFRLDIGNLRGFTYLLQGDVNWAEVIKALSEIGYSDYLMAEVGPPYGIFPEKLIYDTANSLEYILKLAQ